MVKAYLRYAPHHAFGVIASPQCNCVFSEDGEAVFSGCDEAIIVWKASNGTIIKRLTPPAIPPHDFFPHPTTFLCCVPHKQKNLLAGYNDGSVKIWCIDEGGSVLSNFHGHKGAITCIACSEEGDVFATGSKDTDVVVWDIISEAGLYRLRGHQDQVTCVAFLYQRQKRGSGGFSHPPGRGASIKGLLGSPAYLVSCGKDSYVKIWDLGTQSCVQTLVDATGNVWSLAYSMLNNRLFVGSNDPFIRVYELHLEGKISTESSKQNWGEEWKAEEKASLSTFGYPVFATLLGTIPRRTTRHRISQMKVIPFLLKEPPYPEKAPSSKSGETLASSGGSRLDGGLLLCVGKNGKQMEVFRLSSALKMRQKARRRRRRLQEKLQKKQERVNELIKKKEGLKKTSIHEKNLLEKEIVALQLKLSVGGSVKGMRRGSSNDADDSFKLSDEISFLYAVSTKDKVASFDIQSFRGVEGGSFTKGGGKGGGNLRLVFQYMNNWMEIRKSLAEFEAFDEKPPNTQPEALEKPSSAASDSILQPPKTNKTSLLPLEDITSVAASIRHEGHTSCVRSLSVSHDDKLVLTVSDDTAKFWNIATCRCMHTLPLGKGYTGLCGFFVSGNDHVVIGMKEGDIALYDIRSCSLEFALDAHTAAVQALSESPDHFRFASVSTDSTLKIFGFIVGREAEPSPAAIAEGSDDVSTSHTHTLKASVTSRLKFRLLKETPLADKGVNVCYSPDGKFIGVCTLNNMMQLLFSDSLKMSLNLYGHALPVSSLDITTDGILLASGSFDKTVKIWDTEFGNIRRSYRAHTEPVTSVKWMRDTHYLVSVGKDHIIRLWDCDSHEMITQLLGHPKPITCLALSYDADFFITGGGDQAIRSWTRTSEQLFIEEEREKELELQLESSAARDDAQPTVGISSSDIIFNRPSRRTMESVRTAERLMEIIDESTADIDALEDYYTALAQWREAEENAKKMLPEGGTSVKHSIHPPVKPPSKVEALYGKAPMQHVIVALSSLPGPNFHEVLISMPYGYAEKLLKFIAAYLKGVSSLNSLKESVADSEDFIPCPIESVCKAALFLVQLHFRLFISSEQHQEVLVDLHHHIRPLLVQEKERMLFCSAALGFIKKDIEDAKFVGFDVDGKPPTL